MFKGNGHLKRMPSLTLLRNKIIQYIRETKLEFNAFQHSHELLIRADIPLKYIESIIVYNSDVKVQIQKQLDALKKNIPVKLFPSQAHFNPSVFIAHLTSM